MPDVFRKLEFDKVIERISELTVSESGHHQAHCLIPKTNRIIIESELTKVTEAKAMLIAEGSIPLDAFTNILPALKKTAVENQALSIKELLEITTVIHVSHSMKGFLSKRIIQYPDFGTFHNQLFADKVIEYHISEALDKNGFVKDTASKEWREIRKSIVLAGEALRQRLESILRQVSDQELLQEEIITTRDGRLVIPIKSEFKHRVPGFIHSTSASGATVYIEPAESLELNNALRELQLREEREIHRILLDLTCQINKIREPLEKSFLTLTELDVIFARAKYSIEILGNSPSLSLEPRIKLYDARHPIMLRHLKRDEVIPLTIELGGNIQTMVITGPNAGGKTVAMKTVGLLVLCTQAGIHIPATMDSEIFPFHDVFADIGDDQSIENDLSTFSSHLLSLRKILKDANEHSLILIDEIGAGTDPSIGGALAMAALNEMTKRRSITIATTHNGMLKIFAHETSGMCNASMEFDQQFLRPTYHFRSGIPGSSYAFELAERLGISRDLLKQARELVGDETNRLESLLIEVERQSQEYERQLREITSEKKNLELSVLSYEQKMTQLKREIGTMRKKAIDEAKEIVQHAHAKVEQSIKEIREKSANREIVRSSRQVLKQLGDKLQKLATNESIDEEIEHIEIGDIVRIRDGREIGEIIELNETCYSAM